VTDKIQASDALSLDQLTGKVHDWWFSKDDIVHDPQRRQVIIPVSNARCTSVVAELRFGAVRDVKLHDDANIGCYDINELRYDAGQGRVQLLSGFPFSLELRVDRLEAELRPIA